MNVLTILGSPRLNGNTSLVLDQVESEIRASGHTIDRVNVANLAISGCRECLSCKNGDINLCAIGDDAHEVFEKMLSADVLLLASPVFCWGFPAQLKALLDRMFCLIQEVETGNYTSGIAGKTLGLLVTAGGQVEDNAELLERSSLEMAKFMHLRFAGTFFAVNFAGPESLTPELGARASEFAKRLIRTGY